MGIFDDFKALRDRPKHQHSRASQPVTEEMLANYTAVRAFLYGEWFGASLMVASYTLMMALTLGPRLPPRITLPVSLAVFALGTFILLRNRTYYNRLDFRWAPRWHGVALWFGMSGALFWAMVALLAILAAFGVNVGPRA